MFSSVLRGWGRLIQLHSRCACVFFAAPPFRGKVDPQGNKAAEEQEGIKADAPGDQHRRRHQGRAEEEGEQGNKAALSGAHRARQGQRGGGQGEQRLNPHQLHGSVAAEAEGLIHHKSCLLYTSLTAAGEQEVIVSTCCHTVNLLVQKHFPEVLPALAKVVSPMQAHCRDLKRRYPGCRTVFIGPCISKKDEAEAYPGIVDCVLTFEELSAWLDVYNRQTPGSCRPAPGSDRP